MARAEFRNANTTLVGSLLLTQDEELAPFTIKCTNSIYRDRLKAGPTASTSLYSFVEDRIAVLSTWQERPIKNIVDFGLQAGPVFRNTHDLAILKVQADK